jgi:hypothetical protein
MFTYAIVIMTEFESVEAAALERSHGIETSAVVAHVLVAATLVYVNARVASCRQRIPVVTDTLKTTVQVRAFAISTYSISLVALVDVCLSIELSLYYYIFSFFFRAVRTHHRRRTQRLTHTLPSGGSELIPFGTLTFERTGRVDALRDAPARSWYPQTFVVV